MATVETRSLEEILRDLPQELREEVQDFVEFLLSRKVRRVKRIPTFAWAGALADMKEQYGSVELQHKIADWRSE